MATTTMDLLAATSCAAIPFNIFQKDLNQYSLGDMKDEDSKAFLWHQFMLDVLLNIPRSSADNEDVITACRRVNELSIANLTELTKKLTTELTTELTAELTKKLTTELTPELITELTAELSNKLPAELPTDLATKLTKQVTIELKPEDIDKFRTTYTSDEAVKWYTRDTFLYRAFNKACRTVDSDAIIQFHSFVKDLDIQLKQLHLQQKREGTLKLPMTVYRGQAPFSIGEIEKLRMNQGSLISMNTFLSTTCNCGVATDYIVGANRDTSVFFEITVNDTQDDERLQTFANISQYSKMPHEQEVLFGMSSVFKVISVEQYDCFWVVNLELTSCKEDQDVQKLMNEVKTYLYQISDKQLPFIVFKQLFTTTSDGYSRPFMELMQFFLADLTQLFVNNVYKKEGKMKAFIDEEPALFALMEETSGDVVCSNEATICRFFDLLIRFLYDKDKTEQEQISFDMNDKISLLCFGGFLLIIGEWDKSIRYFEMLLKNNSIDDRLKIFIHGLLGATYAMMEKKELASKHIPIALQLLESSVKSLIPSWCTAYIASAHIALTGPNEQAIQTLDTLQPLINKKQSNEDVNEKLRLLLLGHISAEQQNFVAALNHWEEALEITSYITSSVVTVFNGAIYLQMAAAYLKLNNISEALKVLEKSLKCMEFYYPSTHRMFASLNLMYGYYLIQNEKPLEGIEQLKKSLTNPYFSTNNDFLGIVYTLLAMGSMQAGDMDSTEQYGHKALEYNKSPTEISILIPSLLEVIPQLKLWINTLGPDCARQFVGMGVKLGQQILSNINTNANSLPELTNDQTWTSDQFINYGDHYRHRQDYTRAETYYRKALENMTEIESQSIWNVYKKMMRMNKDDNNRYQDYFIEQYSKYDADNPEHYEMIATLQIIMYKFSLSQNELELAFDCLIYGVFLAVKVLYHQINADSNYISNLCDRAFHHDQIAKASSMLTKLIQMYSTNWTVYIRQFLLTSFAADDRYIILSKIIHHSEIDSTLDQMKSKYSDDQSSESIFQLLETLLQLFRQSTTRSERSTISFSDQILEFLTRYNDETAPLFYLIKILESFLMGNTPSLLFNLDKFQHNTVTFECYKVFKEKISAVFERLEEDQLRICLDNMAKNL